MIIDCTYCTNKENYKICEIVGVTSEYSTFFRAHAILSNETRGSYQWLFDQYIDIMSEQFQPGIVVTDKDPAIMTTAWQRLKDINAVDTVIEIVTEAIYSNTEQG
ncbi:MAG: hypothetical protein EZS28_055102, partial [Streblomastix strix]